MDVREAAFVRLALGEAGMTAARAGTSTGAPGARTRLPRIRWRTTLPALLVLALAVHTLLPQIATLQATTAVLRHLRWWALALAVLAQGASYWGNGYTVRTVARLARDSLTEWEATRLAIAAGSIGLLAGGPVGYATATFHWARARGMSYEGAVLCGWLPGILNTIVLIALSLFGIAVLLLRHLLSRSLLLALAPLGVVAAAIVLAATLLLRREERLTVLISRTRRAWARLRHRPVDERAISAAVQRITAARRLLWSGGWRTPLLGAVANAGFDVLTLLGLFIAARHTPALSTLLAGYGLPQLLGRITFLPGGIGIVEGGMVGLYVALGVPAPAAVLVVLGYRALSFWLPTLVGFPLAALLQRATTITVGERAGG